GSEPIYLDYAATTPVDPAVAEAMSRCLIAPEGLGNASSATHLFGRRVAGQIEGARAQIAALIGAAPAEIFFTSGATESDNLALLGGARANAHRGRHIVSSRIEHKAVLDPLKRLEKECFAVTLLSPDRSGRVVTDAIRAALRRRSGRFLSTCIGSQSTSCPSRRISSTVPRGPERSMFAMMRGRGCRRSSSAVARKG